ncbi:MAG: tetratricopeptide repeat protein [Anaerolineae bacterium]|nr:tetratricopeptide repeat protein [Anaerolineae bacterium]
MSELRVFLLGTPHFECDAAPVKITRRKIMALLAYLAVSGQSHSREAIATLLWPDFDATSAYAYLRNALWMLKQTPITEWLEVEVDILGLRKDPSLWVDVAHFQANLAACRAHAHSEHNICELCVPLLTEAVTLYQGDFMAGFTLGDSADFDEWQFYQTESLRRAMSGVLEKLVLWHRQQCELEKALEYARRWQSFDPLHEGAQRYLMTLYAQLDRRSTALRLYETLLRNLRTQGLAPSEETVTLYQRIRAGDDLSERHIGSPVRQLGKQVGNPVLLPTGTITFLFTDIQGSVALWDQKPQAMKIAIAKHHALLRQGIESNGGIVFKIVGDAFQAAFPFASQALVAAIATQRALCRAAWGETGPLSVRMGLHTGPVELASDDGPVDYAVSHTLNRAARVMSAGYGGQILLSQETAALVQYEMPPNVSLKDLGTHRLKGLTYPQRLFQVIAPDIPRDFPPLSTEVKPHYNLPAQATAFVGRAAELSELHGLLASSDVRLVTLTGSGGIGKTRLALRLAEESIGAFPDGIFFVSLATVAVPELMISTLADVLGVTIYQQGMIAPWAQLIHYLRNKQMLLVLDNLEQLLSCATMLGELLQQTEKVKLLVTSRERLNLQGEWVLKLSGLRYPEEGTTENVDMYGAVQLFLERARRVHHGFVPGAEDLADIVRICHLLEGMPLGLELAAAWIKLLSCREIADEIAGSLDFLSLALRDLPERHQSLRAVFAHSWRLLSQEERASYCALAIFRGGFTRAAATDVAGASLPLLASLMDKSMLRRSVSGRYEIQEILRQYAEEQLATMPEQSDAVHDRHCDYYLDLLRRLEPALKGPGRDVTFGQLAALDTIQQDLENIRAAWRWAIAHSKMAAMHAAIFSLGMFCDIRSRFREGLELFGEASTTFSRPGIEVDPEFLGLILGIQGECLMRLSMPESLEVLQRSLLLLDAICPGPALALVNVLSSYAVTWHTPEEIGQRLDNSLVFYQTQNNLWGMALTLDIMALNLDLLIHHDREAARQHAHQSLELRRQIGDRWGTAISLFTLGVIAESSGGLPDARRYYQESLSVRQELKDVYGVAYCIHNVGRILYQLGEVDTARQLQLQSLTSLRDVGALHGIPDVLQTLAVIAHDRGNLQEAKSLLLEASTTRRAIGEVKSELASTLLHLGKVALELAEIEAAQGYFSESLALFEKFGHTHGREQALAGLTACTCANPASSVR